MVDSKTRKNDKNPEILRLVPDHLKNGMLRFISDCYKDKKCMKKS